MAQDFTNIIYWHRELPPIAASPWVSMWWRRTARASQAIAHRDELWDQYYEDLMSNVGVRLEQEVRRLGGNLCALLDETVDSRHND